MRHDNNNIDYMHHVAFRLSPKIRFIRCIYATTKYVNLANLRFGKYNSGDAVDSEPIRMH